MVDAPVRTLARKWWLGFGLLMFAVLALTVTGVLPSILNLPMVGVAYFLSRRYVPATPQRSGISR